MQARSLEIVVVVEIASYGRIASCWPSVSQWALLKRKGFCENPGLFKRMNSKKSILRHSPVVLYALFSPPPLYAVLSDPCFVSQGTVTSPVFIAV